MPSEWFTSIPPQTAERTCTDVASFDTAYAASASGAHDRIVMGAGTYNMVRSIGKSGLQIIANGHVKIVGGITITGSNNWFVGIELTDPLRTAVQLFHSTGQNNRWVNCWIHHSGDDNAVGIADFGQGCLVYGCVIHNCRHVIYIHNKNTDPIKYYAHNFISRATPDSMGAGEYLIHCYSEASRTDVRNQKYLENVFSEGSLIHGSTDLGTTWGLEFERNIFDRANFKSYVQPTHIHLKDNRFYKNRSGSSRLIDFERLHGVGETFDGPPYYPQQNVIKNNLIYQDQNISNNVSFWIGTSYRDGSGQHLWNGDLLPDDDVDLNSFYGFFRQELRAGGGAYPNTTTIANWRTATNTEGKQYDTNSTFTSGAPPDYYTVLQNDYDPDRAMIFAWGNGATVSVTLPRTGDIYDVYDQWGTPLFTGGTNYNVPTNGLGFTGIVKYAAAGGGGGDFPVVEETIVTEREFDSTSHTINYPSVVNAGDLILTIIMAHVDAVSLSNPTGFTQLYNSGAGWPTYIGVKKATGTEGGTTFTVNLGASRYCCAVTYRISGWRDSGIITNDVEIANNASHNPPSLNPTNWDVENTLWLAVDRYAPLSDWISDPANYSNVQVSECFDFIHIRSLERELQAASEDPATFVYSTATNAPAAFTIAIRPTASGAPSDPGGTVFGTIRSNAHLRHRRN